MTGAERLVLWLIGTSYMRCAVMLSDGIVNCVMKRSFGDVSVYWARTCSHSVECLRTAQASALVRILAFGDACTTIVVERRPYSCARSWTIRGPAPRALNAVQACQAAQASSGPGKLWPAQLVAPCHNASCESEHISAWNSNRTLTCVHYGCAVQCCTISRCKRR